MQNTNILFYLLQIYSFGDMMRPFSFPFVKLLSISSAMGITQLQAGVQV